MVPLPPEVLAFADRGPGWAAYVDRLPRLARELTEEWGLEVDGAPLSGYASLVVPVRGDGEPAVLKLTYPDPETEHEALALQKWHGDGAVRLLRADPRRRALLLERLQPRDLDELGDLEACEVVAGLYGRLHVAPPPQLVTLPAHLDRFTDRLAALPRDAPVPHRLVQQAVALSRAFATDPGSTGVMVHGDLHYANVLAADREPWLAIDPHAMNGDPHYEPAPMLWNRWEEVVGSGNVRDAVRRRFLTLVDAAGLEEDRARDWVVVRMVHQALWELEDHPADPDGAYLTRCVTIAKAVQE